MNYLWISYHPSDTLFALQIAGDLKMSGGEVHIDKLDSDNVAQAQGDIVAVLALLSPDYIESGDGKTQLSRSDIPVYRLLVEQTQATSDDDFSEWYDKEKYSISFTGLVQKLRTKHPEQFGQEPDKEGQYLLRMIVRLEQQRFANQLVEFNGDIVTGEMTFCEDSDNSTKITNINEKNQHQPYTIIIGDIGSGKTTLLYRLALKEAYQRFRNRSKSRLPILIDLQTWEDEPTIWDLVRAFWRMDDDPEKLSSELLLCLDNLDYLPSDKADQLLKWLIGLTAEQKVIVACNESVPLEIPYPRIRLEITETQIKQIAPHILEEDTENFLSLVLTERREQLFSLACDLNLLRILITIYSPELEEKIPAIRGQLYGTICYFFWMQGRGIPYWVPFEQAEAKLAEFAFNTLKDDISITRELVESNTVLQLAEVVGMIEPQLGELRFRHSFVRDYLVAIKLFDEDIETILSEPTFDSISGRSGTKWDNALIIMAGLLENPAGFIAGILSIDPFLAAKCIKTGLDIDEGFKKPLVNVFVQMLEDNYSGIRIAAAKALADIGDASTIPALVNALLNPKKTDSLSLDDLLKDTFGFDMSETGIADIPGLLDSFRQDNALDNFATISITEAIAAFGEKSIPTLLSLVRDTRLPYEIGFNALISLIRFKNSSLIPDLLVILRSGSPYGQMIATSLSDFGEPARKGLLDTLNNSNPEVRHYAMWGLISLADESCIPNLITALDDENELVRTGAGAALSKIGTSTLTSLLQKLSNADNNIIPLITDVLASFGSLATDGLLAELKTPDHYKRAHLANALAKIGVPAMQLLFDKLYSGTTNERIGAAWALGMIGEPARPELLRAMEHENEEVRRAVISGATQPNLVDMSIFVKALSDENVNVRMQALHSIAKFENSNALPLYIQALEDPQTEIRQRAVQALVSIGQEAIPELLNAIQGESEKVRMVAARVLGALGEAGKPTLLELLKDKRSQVRLATRIALGEMEDALPQRLIEVIEEKGVETSIYVTAASILSQIADKDDENIVLRMFQSENWQVRMIAISILADIASKERLLEIIADRNANSNAQVAAMFAIVTKNLEEIPESSGIITHLQSHNPVLRLSAAITIEAVNDDGISSELGPIIHDKNYFVGLLASNVLNYKVTSDIQIDDLFL